MPSTSAFTSSRPWHLWRGRGGCGGGQQENSGGRCCGGNRGSKHRRLIGCRRAADGAQRQETGSEEFEGETEECKGF